MGNLFFRTSEIKIIVEFDQTVNIATILAVMQARQIGESILSINLLLSHQHLLHHDQTSPVGKGSSVGRGSKDLL